MIGAIQAVAKECWENRRQMVVVSTYNLRFQYNQTRLKLLWAILNPILQAGTYWLALYVGLRVSAPVQGVSYLTWMLTGLVPWFFMAAVMNAGAVSIISARAIIMNMKYPISTIPVGTVCTELLNHFCYMLVLIVIQVISGTQYGVGVLWVLYYIFAAFMLMLGYTFLASTLTVFARDISKAIQMIVRLLFFITPICWALTPDSPLEPIMRWSPFVYVLNGYRGAMLYRGDIGNEPAQHICFWAVTVVILIIGVWLHWKLRDHFVDYL